MTETPPRRPGKAPPLYWRLLRLRHVHPNSWQRAAFFEGTLAVAVVLVLADVASAWLLLALPVAVAAIVKAHDVLVGWLGPGTGPAHMPEPVVAEPKPESEAAAGTEVADTEPPVAAPEPESNIRIVSPPKAPRPARARPGAAAARAQASTRQPVRRRRARPATPEDGAE